MGRPCSKLKYDRGLTPHLGRSSIQSRVLDFKCGGQYLVNVWRRSVPDVDSFRGDRRGDRFNIRHNWNEGMLCLGGATKPQLVSGMNFEL